MTVEHILSRQMIESAFRREAADGTLYQHPVLDILVHLEPQIRDYCQGRPVTDDVSTAQKYVNENFKFFGQAIQELEHFGLKPLDVVAIWSGFTELGLYQFDRYKAAEVLCGKYARRGKRILKGKLSELDSTGKALANYSKNHRMEPELAENLVGGKLHHEQELEMMRQHAGVLVWVAKENFSQGYNRFLNSMVHFR